MPDTRTSTGYNADLTLETHAFRLLSLTVGTWKGLIAPWASCSHLGQWAGLVRQATILCTRAHL